MTYIPSDSYKIERKKAEEQFEKEEKERKKKLHEHFVKWCKQNPEKSVKDYIYMKSR